jgi:alkaline phosphatase D
VVISGDIHSFFANDLKLDFDDPASPLSPPNSSAARSPHTARHTIRLRRCCRTIPMCIFSTAGGAVITADAMQVRMRVVSDAHDPKAAISTFKTFAVEGGRPGVIAA